MVHAEGTKLVDGSGKTVFFKGILLEGWLQWNGVIWEAGFQSETDLLKRLETLVGAEEVKNFRETVYQQFITEKDIEAIAGLGLNMVRVPINHRALDDGAGWRMLDRLMDWCERHRVYVMLDMHSAPGGQSGVFVCDPDTPDLWAAKANQDATVELWRELALRYRDREILMGYDLLNEPGPFWGFQLVEFYERITLAIRKVDPDHLIIVEGNHLAADFSIFTKAPKDSNVAYSFHTYNFTSHKTCEKQLNELRKLSLRHDVPLINGEFGAHTREWIGKTISLFGRKENGVSGWVFWPWKSVRRDYPTPRERWMYLNAIQPGQDWYKLADWLAIPALNPKPSPQQAKEAMGAFITASRPRNLKTIPDIERLIIGR